MAHDEHTQQVGLLSGAGLVALTQQKPDASSVPYAASSSSSAAGPVPLQSTAVVPSTSKDMFKFGPMPGPIADLLTRFVWHLATVHSILARFAEQCYISFLETLM